MSALPSAFVYLARKNKVPNIEIFTKNFAILSDFLEYPLIVTEDGNFIADYINVDNSTIIFYKCTPLFYCKDNDVIIEYNIIAQYNTKISRITVFDADMKVIKTVVGNSSG